MNRPDLLSLKAADRISQLLVVLMMGFAAAAIYIPIQNAQVAHAIERAARFEIGFSGQDAKIAVALLNQDIARYRIEPTPERAAAAQGDYAVLVGRGKDFRHGEFGAFVAQSPKPGAEVAEFESTMSQLAPLVAGITQGHNAARAAELAQKLEQPIQLLASQAVIANSESASARQEQLRGQQLQTILLTIGLLITSCGLIVMLDRQNKFVRKTHLKQIEATKKYEFLASHDPLTGLPNRARFGQALGEALASLGAPGREVALLTVDLDQFKTINDTLGHSAGDTLLVFVARRLERLTKMQPGALVARVGGDEFLALVEGDGVEKQAIDLAAAALEALCEPYALDGRSIVVHASVGIAIAPTHGANVGDLITNSDAALHRAKRAGRGVACLFREDMDEEARERKALGSDLAQSIERDEFEPHYQPVIQFATGGIVGVEALARWRLPTRSGTQASIFLPLAEETGAIASLGRRILEIACLDAAVMPPHFHVAVNVSPVQFLRGDIVETVKQALALSGLAASRLQLEFGEERPAHR